MLQNQLKRWMSQTRIISNIAAKTRVSLSQTYQNSKSKHCFSQKRNSMKWEWVLEQNPRYQKISINKPQTSVKLQHNIGRRLQPVENKQHTFKRLRKAARISFLTLYRVLTFSWVAFIAAQTRFEISGPSLGLMDLTHSSWSILNSCLKSKKAGQTQIK